MGKPLVPITCPRRMELDPQDYAEGLDHFGNDLLCSYCGSLEPREFMRLAEASVELEPTDKPYKVYVGDLNRKFYFQHLDSDQRKRFVDMINGRRLRMGYPGHFYVLPFFVERVSYLKLVD